MFSVCQTSHPATTVEHSVECKFYHLGESNLVTVGANQLAVYRIVSVPNPKIKPDPAATNSQTAEQPDEIIFRDQGGGDAGTANECPVNIKMEPGLEPELKSDPIKSPDLHKPPDLPKPPEPEETSRLEFCQSFELYGNIASLQKVTLGNKRQCRRDSLVMSFHDAKLSIVEYDPETHDLKTISLHYFEDPAFRDGCVTNHIYPPQVRVDPDNLCIAMLVYGRHVVIIPLYKDEEEDLEDDLYNSSTSSSLLGSPSTRHNLIDGEEPMSGVTFDEPLNSSTFHKPILGQAATLKPAITSGFKSPVLPSYKIDLSEETCGEKIDNIVDLQFLHNYNDPTLAILYEPIRTWSGRVAMRQDTFAMVALSMNVHERLQPIIWSVNSLPYDSLRILPVPRPIGGLLILACNELIYLNQSVPAFGMSFNSFTRDSSSFPLNDNQINHHNLITNHVKQESNNNDTDEVDDDGDKGNNSTSSNNNNNSNNNANNSNNNSPYINISLDLSQAVFLNHNKILFILKDGDVYLITLFNDDMRSIKNFHFKRFASTVQPNCLTLCENDLLFIGSHVGDSVLAEIVGDFRSSDNMDSGDDLDDLDELFMDTDKKDETIYLYEHDRLLSSSASGRICYGEASNISESLPHDYRDPYIELITTAGHHKNGSICAFQKTIKPHVEDTYELKHCGSLWAVRPSLFSRPENWRLLLNRHSETMVFSTRGELVEIRGDKCKFDTSAPTVFATNLGIEDLILQIMYNRALLISDDKVIYQLQFEETVCDACAVDSQVVAFTNNDSIYHLQMISSDVKDEENPSASGTRFGLACHALGRITKGKLVSISVYKDVSGMFTCKKGQLNEHLPSYWLFAIDDRGVLEVFSMPDFTQVYSIDNFPSAPNVLSDNQKLFIVDVDIAMPKTQEILMLGMGRDGKKPILFVRSEMELLIYEAFPYHETEIDNHLKIRFKKISSLLLKTILPTPQYHYIENSKHQNHSINDSLLGSQKDKLMITDGRTGNSHSDRNRTSHHHQHHHYQQQQQQQHQTHGQSARERCLKDRHWLRAFKSIGGYDGVFLSGLRPHWIIMTDLGALRLHPMNAEGAIFFFSPYDNNNFIYYTENRELRIARLPNHLNLDSHWPLRKLNMKETVHFVNYHVERKIYCVVTSYPSPCYKIMRVGSEPDTMKIEELNREGGYIAPTTERFRLKLYDPVNWDSIPDCEIEFEEWEQVTCVKNVLLASEGTTSGLKGYIAISTNYCYGEDVPNRGRIWILDLIEVVPEPDRPLTKNKIKKVYCQEQKGPVTTLSHTCGLLMSAVGQKIYLWQLKEEQLDGVAFIDTQIYIHCASSVKNLILVSDVCKSVSLLRYQQETRTLSMVCRDSRPLEVFACDFAVDNELLNFVVMDSEKNVIIYAYDPEHEESHGGTRLLRRADYHLGAHVTSLCRLRGKVPSALIDDKDEATSCRRRHITMFCTVDGAIGFIYPIQESVYQRLYRLQNEMTIALPHPAGLNPKAWRAVKQARPSIPNPCELIIDGDIIKRFLSLSYKERAELTKKIGSPPDKILADIQLIQESTLCF